MIAPLAAAFSTQVSLHRNEAIVKAANRLPDLVQQSRAAPKKRTKFHGNFRPVLLHSSPDANPGSKPFSGGSRAQNIPNGPAYPAELAGYITVGRYVGVLPRQMRLTRSELGGVSTVSVGRSEHAHPRSA